MGKDLVLVGGGHAHMVTLSKLHRFVQRGHRTTVIGPSEHHYYSGMGPGMLGKTYLPRQIRFATRDVVEKQGGRFLKDSVTRIDPKRRMVFTASGATCPYDVLSFNAGSHVSSHMVKGDRKRIYTVKPIEGLMEAQKQLLGLAEKQDVKVAVIGGGAAGAEVAGNVWLLLSKYGRRDFDIRLFSSSKILEQFPGKVRTAVMTSLQSRGIQIFEHHRVTRIKNQYIDLKPGKRYQADIIFLATGVKPSPIFKDSGLPMGPDGGLLVNTCLQCPDHPNIFGGGDCIYFNDQPLNKVGVYAVRQNPVLYENLMAAMEGRALKTFSPGGAYLLIFNLGGGAGVFYKNGVMLNGRMAFWIKNLIDKRFMRKFQSIE
jgi:NADH dehydrogenase FAD-containing subunit